MTEIEIPVVFGYKSQDSVIRLLTVRIRAATLDEIAKTADTILQELQKADRFYSITPNFWSYGEK